MSVDEADAIFARLRYDHFPQAIVACERHGELYRIEYAKELADTLEQLVLHGRVVGVLREGLPRPSRLDELCPLCAERVYARATTLEEA